MVLGFLPVLPNFKWNSASDVRAQRVTIRQVLCDIAKIVLEQVMPFSDRGDITSSALWPCSNSKMRYSWPILASWLADLMEHANLMGIKYNSCTR